MWEGSQMEPSWENLHCLTGAILLQNSRLCVPYPHKHTNIVCLWVVRGQHRAAPSGRSPSVSHWVTNTRRTVAITAPWWPKRMSTTVKPSWLQPKMSILWKMNENKIQQKYSGAFESVPKSKGWPQMVALAFLRYRDGGSNRCWRPSATSGCRAERPLSAWRP